MIDLHTHTKIFRWTWNLKELLAEAQKSNIEILSITDHDSMESYNETIWLTQKSMSSLFDVAENNITYHLQNIYNTKELEENRTTQKIRVVQREGNRNVSREVNFYNLDVIISVGYRVNSRRATKFRIWATSILKEYITKGFVLDDERLKQGNKVFGKDYFKELHERVRSIRASERRIWQF